MSSLVRIGLAQISAEPCDVEGNLRHSENAIRAAFEDDADIVVLPEMIVSGYLTDRQALLPVAESVPGPTVEAWSELAAEGQGYVAGGFCEIDGEALYNTAVLVGPTGLIMHYRKVHLFADEKIVFRPGNLGFPVADTRFGTIGLCVCYDLRFVEVVRILALKGADLICVPTAWLPGFDQERWDAEGMCPQAKGAVLQANLNQVFIACASQAGPHGDFDFLGSSVLADPYGRRIVGPMPGSEQEVVVVEVDIRAAQKAQVRGSLISPRADRRTDVYRIVTEGLEL